MSPPNVINLGASSKQPARLPPIVHRIRQHARDSLNDLIETLFNSTDDALFEMADRASTNTEQVLYFESMRQIRLDRAAICVRFAEQFYASWERLFAPADLDGEDQETEALALVANEDLEVDVAIAGIVSKVTGLYNDHIVEMTERLDILCKVRSVTATSNPMGPRQLGETFARATAGLELDIRVLLILLKLFERLVMERLGDAYDETNALMAEAGVMPDYKRKHPGLGSVRRHTQRPQGRNPDPERSLTCAADAGPNLSLPFSALQQLLAGTRSSASADSWPQSNSIAAIQTPQLVRLLSDLQQANDADGARFDPSIVPPLLNLRDIVTRTAGGAGAGRPPVAQPDDDAINVVGLLFDYILNDRNLAIPMKALIARLQIPYVKLAVIDKRFFNQSTHPARALLNELASAGIGWSSAGELKRDARYNKIESIVVAILNGFADDPEFFDDLVRDLRAFLGQENKRLEQLEQRVQQTETGKAITRDIKAQVQQIINRKAAGLRLPAAVGRFISDTFARSLVLSGVRDGVETRLWQERLETLDDLLWCCQPLTERGEIEQRDAMLPQLYGRLAPVIAMVRDDGGAGANQLRTLQAELAEVADRDHGFLEDDLDAPPELPEAYAPVAEIHLTEVNPPPDDSDRVEPQVVDRLAALSEGTWVEIRHPDSELMRCKLTTIVQPGDRYIFVNRRGMKVAEYGRTELARLLADEQLTVLDESQVFDRALQAVVGNLRQLQQQPAPIPDT